MILHLRQRHRRIVTLLGVVLPIAFVFGIAARRPVPPIETLPSELLPQTQVFTATELIHDELFEKSSVNVRLWRDLGNGQLAVDFVAPKDFLKPDLIVYWVAGRPTMTDALPEDAILLGSFVSSVLPLPAQAATTKGVLVLFSLANQEIVDVSKPVLFNVSTH